MIQCVEQKVKHQTENKILKEQIASLEMKNADLCDDLAAKELRYQFTLSQLAETNILLKESKSKLQPSSVATAFTQTTSYSDAVSTAHITSAKQPTTAPRSSVLQHFADEEETEPPVSASSWTTIAPSPTVPTPPSSVQDQQYRVPVSNRFHVLEDETGDHDNSKPKKNISPAAVTTNGDSTNMTKEKTNKTKTNLSFKTSPSKPTVLILGDSISNGIESQHLSSKANVINHSRGGRRIEQVTAALSTSTPCKADTVIIHVGTNNLESDSANTISEKLHLLCSSVKTEMPNCKVGLSSIVQRKDKPYLKQKLDTVNNKLYDICANNNWTFIDNSAIQDFTHDKLHPNARGLSFLARNYQTFLKKVHPSLFRQGRKQTYQHRPANLNQQSRGPLLGNAPAWLTYLMGITRNTCMKTM